MKSLLILFAFIGLNSMAFGQCDDTTKCKYVYDQLETTQYTRICPTKFSGGQIEFYSSIKKESGVSHCNIFFTFDGDKRCITESKTKIEVYFTDGEKMEIIGTLLYEQKINCDNLLKISLLSESPALTSKYYKWSNQKEIEYGNKLKTKLVKGIRFTSNHVYDAMFTLEEAKRFQELLICMHESKEDAVRKAKEEEEIKKKKELDDAHMIPKKKKEKKKDDDDGVHMTPKKKKTN